MVPKEVERSGRSACLPQERRGRHIADLGREMRMPEKASHSRMAEERRVMSWPSWR